MRIAVDAMGGDQAPGAVVQGCLDAAAEFGVAVVLVGPEETVRAELARRGGAPPGITLQHAPEVISTHEEPAMAVRRKKENSISVAMRLVRDGGADACLSAGSTGALMVAGKILLKALPGVDRPALPVLLPTRSARPTLLLDVGANVDSRPEHLLQWAVMGSVYAESVLGRPRPTVALLNIGVEEEKGNALVKAALPLLRQVPDLNLVGYLEPREVPLGQVDVVVADGFVGNVVLKTFEGVADALLGMIKGAFRSSVVATVGGLLARPALRRMGRQLDYAEYGGAPLLGLRHPAVKCHGSSNARAIRSGIKVARDLVAGKAVARIEAQVARLAALQLLQGQKEDAAEHE